MKKEKTELHEIGGYNVWLTYLPIYWHHKDRNIIEESDDFLCYFNFNEPGLIFGELILDENDKPKIFSSTDKISEFAAGYVKKKFSL